MEMKEYWLVQTFPSASHGGKTEQVQSRLVVDLPRFPESDATGYSMMGFSKSLIRQQRNLGYFLSSLFPGMTRNLSCVFVRFDPFPGNVGIQFQLFLFSSR